LLAYAAALFIWLQILPLYDHAVAAVAQSLLPVLEHPRLTTALEAVAAGDMAAGIEEIAVYSRPLKPQGALYTIHARNVFGSAPALAALILTLPYLAGKRIRALLRAAVYLFAFHVLFVQVKLYHLYSIEVQEVRDLLYTDLFRFLIRGAHIFFLTVGSEAVIAFAAVVAVIATYLAPKASSPEEPGSRSARRLRFLPADVVATVGVLMGLVLVGTLLPQGTTPIFADRVEAAENPTPNLLMLAGYERLQTDDPEGARLLFLRVLETEPSHSAAHNELANMALASEDWVRVALHLRKVLEADPADTAALANLGAAEIRLSEPAAAKAHLARSLELSPELVPPRLTLARLLRALGRQKEAVDLLRAAPRDGPPDARADALLGQYLEEAGDPCQALHHYQRALAVAAELSPTDLLTLQQRTTTLERDCPDPPGL
jgi:tetratricopeptide (TPR) repeat protein